MSSEISGGKFPEIYSNLSFRKFVSQLFPSPALQSYAVELAFLDKQLSRSFCFNFVHCVTKHILVLARLPGISTNSNENYRRFNFQAFANISGNFPENFRKIYNHSSRTIATRVRSHSPHETRMPSRQFLLNSGLKSSSPNFISGNPHFCHPHFHHAVFIQICQLCALNWAKNHILLSVRSVL